MIDNQEAQLLTDGVSTLPKSESMIERVASALEADFDYDHPARRFISKDEWKIAAKAAIEALRDLYKTLPGLIGNKEDDDRLNVAIDAALKNG